jgi:hypothetical protein
MITLSFLFVIFPQTGRLRRTKKTNFSENKIEVDWLAIFNDDHEPLVRSISFTIYPNQTVVNGSIHVVGYSTIGCISSGRRNALFIENR